MISYNYNIIYFFLYLIFTLHYTTQMEDKPIIHNPIIKKSIIHNSIIHNSIIHNSIIPIFICKGECYKCKDKRCYSI